MPKNSLLISASLLLIVIPILATSACGAKNTMTKVAYPEQYKSSNTNVASKVVDSEVEIKALFSPLQELFADLTQPDVTEKVTNVYAESLYFNDTIHTYSSHTALAEYMSDIAKNVDHSSVEFHEITPARDSYYIRWTMKIQLNTLGKKIDTESIGISQIRFNDEGKIIFHQDFWDNTEGLFRHLPIVGFWIKKAKDRM